VYDGTAEGTRGLVVVVGLLLIDERRIGPPNSVRVILVRRHLRPCPCTTFTIFTIFGLLGLYVVRNVDVHLFEICSVWGEECAVVRGLLDLALGPLGWPGGLRVCTRCGLDNLSHLPLELTQHRGQRGWDRGYFSGARRGRVAIFVGGLLAGRGVGCRVLLLVLLELMLVR
jgi:hypothetical protein